jgi:hypothetical protein
MTGFGQERPFMVSLAKGRLRITKRSFADALHLAGFDQLGH